MDINEIINNIKQDKSCSETECKICGKKLKEQAVCYCSRCRILSRAELAEIILKLRKG